MTNELPSYLNLESDGRVRVETKEGEFILEEPTGETFDSVMRLMEKDNSMTQFKASVIMAARSMVEPEDISEESIMRKHKISTLKRIVEGFNVFIEDGDNFLQNTETESKTIQPNQ